MKKDKLKNKSIMKKILSPMCLLVAIQFTIFITALFMTNIVQKLTQNQIDVLQERLINRASYLEDQMVNRWSNISLAVDSINQKANYIAALDTAKIDLLAKDPDIYTPFLEDCMDDIISLLRNNSVTGAFIILNTDPLDNQNLERKPGIYIIDSEPNSQASNQNKDLLLERAPTQIAKNSNMSTSVNWQPGFEFAKLKRNYFSFLQLPYEAAIANPNLNYKDLGYWSEPFSLNNLESDQSIAYAVPLVLKNGTVYGVVGVSVSFDQMTKALPYTEVTKNKNGAYILGITQGDSLQFHNVMISGPSYRQGVLDKNITSLEKSSYDTGYDLVSPLKSSSNYLGCMQRIKLYNTNTPFSSQQWCLIAVGRNSDLFAFTQSILLILIFLFIGLFLTSLFSVYWLSYYLAKPIERLALEVRESNPKVLPNFTRTNITEIDELAHSVENLTQDIQNFSSKFTQIMEMASVRIGGYDIDSTKGTIFLTEHFFEIFNMDYVKAQDITPEGFWHYMDHLSTYIVKEGIDDPNHSYAIYHISGKENDTWIRLKNVQQKGHLIGLVEDITQEHNALKKLDHERDYDLLTNLLNRRSFYLNMSSLFNKPESLKISALVVFDLDNLKYVNDTYGHDYGDDYIISAAKSFLKFSPPNTLLARISGDEYYLFLYGYDTKEELQEIIYHLKNNFDNQKFHLPDGRTFRLRASGGISWYPEDSTEYLQLMQYADFALYKVKTSYKGALIAFDRQSYDRESYLLQSEEALDFLLEKQAVTYYFQPIISSTNGDIFAFEALMRSKVNTLKSPLEILTLAKKESKLNQIERLTWFKATEAFVNHIKAGKILPECKMFINSIPNQILSDEDASLYQETYKDYFSRIVQEFTEEERLDDEMHLKKTKLLADWKMELALDDYGSGYNNEIALLKMAPKYIKIDLSIIRDIDHDKNKQRLVENLVSYSHERGIILIAEGIETQNELETVIRLGIDLLQGYLLAMPSAEIQAIDPKIIALIKTLNKTDHTK